jgi:Integron-associated effector binding protein
MDKYSHGQFQVSGFVYNITSPQESQKQIQAAWSDFMSDNKNKLIVNKAYPHVHAVYYNYNNLDNPSKEGYEMLLGYITEDNSKQTNPQLTDLVIPPQDYMYTKCTGNFQEVLPIEWAKINNIPKSEVNRDHGYDLEMYSEDYKTATLAVSVIENK